MKTSELKGQALDWAVAKCEGVENTWGKSSMIPYDYFTGHRYSTDWAQGGPIIERERVGLWPDIYGYFAEKNHFGKHHCAGRSTGWGTTPLIAAMRCYVTSKLGAEVEVPDELKGEK